MKQWKKLLETELPRDINLSKILKFCATTRFLYIETAPTFKNVEFYQGGYIEEISVIVQNEKYFLPVDSEENLSWARAPSNQLPRRPTGKTKWRAVRIAHGQYRPQIDITDFTFAKRNDTHQTIFLRNLRKLFDIKK